MVKSSAPTAGPMDDGKIVVLYESPPPTGEDRLDVILEMFGGDVHQALAYLNEQERLRDRPSWPTGKPCRGVFTGERQPPKPKQYQKPIESPAPLPLKQRKRLLRKIHNV